ncbi:rolling circle replication-associated protein [Blautia sp.]|uniref:rolling circle replication-associated protein n=1 Tax=Blautia sp. TaxID=1955243 RepID=UPI00258CDFBD|nr:Rep protein [Blautia sp.]
MDKANQCFVYNTKIIETPTTKEVYFYENPIYTHSHTEAETNLPKSIKRKTFDEMSAHKQYDSLKRKQKHYEQTRWEIARIVDCNFDNKTKFLTLTFKENIQDITITNKDFKYFIQRLNYYLYQTKVQTLKYIATWEKQKRGAIHYHVIFFDFPYIPKNKLQDLWTHGFIKINRIDVDSKENRGRYLSKYFGKDLELKEHKKKAFFKSQNLIMPTEQKLMLTGDILKELSQENIVFQKEYTRQVYDMKSLVSTGSYLKDSSVIYIKIKKEGNRFRKRASDG